MHDWRPIHPSSNCEFHILTPSLVHDCLLTDNFLWALNPNSQDTAGFVLDDWRTVNGFLSALIRRVQPEPSVFIGDITQDGTVLVDFGAYTNPACSTGAAPQLPAAQETQHPATEAPQVEVPPEAPAVPQETQAAPVEPEVGQTDTSPQVGFGSGCSDLWGQCGGSHYQGPTCCSADSECHWFDEYYSQCLPAAQTSESQCNALWMQCGGSLWKGATCCETGGECTYLNSWYSQCQPAAADPASTCSPLWEQCGGAHWEGPTCCDPGYECIYDSEWYSQCLPKAVEHDMASCSKVWEQCGGKQWQGPTCCQTSAQCIWDNEWYSQCKP